MPPASPAVSCVFSWSPQRAPPTAAGDDDAAAEAAAGWCWEDVAISAGLVAVQLAGAAYMVVVTPVLALGLDPLFLVTFGSLSTGLFTLPFAINLERHTSHYIHLKWPSEFNNWLLVRFFLLALGGVTVFQALMLHGMKKTSPAIASAMPNLARAFIFIVAGCLRFERVDLRCMYTRAKIAGTLLCLGGAVTMSAATMAHFPAPFTLCSVTSLAGAALTGAFQAVPPPAGSALARRISAYRSSSPSLLVGGVVSSVCVMFQTWALEKKGPVVVSLFSPTQTVGSAVFSALFLGRVMQRRAWWGWCSSFRPLCSSVAKKRESQVVHADITEPDGAADDMEKPLCLQISLCPCKQANVQWQGTDAS
ncbi:hypothetical protein GUJ93_ZPchr0007g4049 [Zizania palustris]|uniref:WAT1-related protein n=1 Tax=Zizania palustris TaxID=103762 RepID=A0A8J5TEJ2_ZIZPA|nr:hypothetical protein GUJ93_ZPchr0007g4049 [Zizania palustris]